MTRFESMAAGSRAGGLTEDQQIVRLQEYVAQVFETEPERFFEPGEIIWTKAGSLEAMIAPTAPHAFVGYLAEPVEMIGKLRSVNDMSGSTAARVVDCRVAVMVEPHVAVFLADSRVFTRRPPRREGG